jgi:hypothetical protein
MNCITLSVPTASLLFLFVGVAPVARAGTIDVAISGTLGPVLEGEDPWHHPGGDTFTLTGVLPENSVPVSSTADSATYSIPDLTLMFGSLSPVASNALLTFTDPASGPETVSLAFTATEDGYSPSLVATLQFAEGALHGANLQDLVAKFSESESTLSFSLTGVSRTTEFTVGLTGSLSVNGVGNPSNVPEPGTTTLLAGGLLALGWKGIKRHGQ